MSQRLGVFRSPRQGPMDEPGRRTFEALLPAARAAVRAQFALEGQAAALLGGVLDALRVPAFLLDHAGRVQTVTADQAVLAALHADPARRRRVQTVTARATGAQAPLILDVLALPGRQCALGLAPRVLVVAGNMQRSEQLVALPSALPTA